jgi:ribosome-binding protein aMBF1 (putative translation factor)
VLTGAQIRAARAVLGWSAEDLAKHSKLSRRTIITMESADGAPQTNVVSLEKVRVTLESEGIEFIGAPGKSPGIIIHAKPRT